MSVCDVPAISTHDVDLFLITFTRLFALCAAQTGVGCNNISSNCRIRKLCQQSPRSRWSSRRTNLTSPSLEVVLEEQQQQQLAETTNTAGRAYEATSALSEISTLEHILRTYAPKSPDGNSTDDLPQQKDMLDYHDDLSSWCFVPAPDKNHEVLYRKSLDNSREITDIRHAPIKFKQVNYGTSGMTDNALSSRFGTPPHIKPRFELSDREVSPTCRVETSSATSSTPTLVTDIDTETNYDDYDGDDEIESLLVDPAYATATLLPHRSESKLSSTTPNIPINAHGFVFVNKRAPAQQSFSSVATTATTTTSASTSSLHSGSQIDPLLPIPITAGLGSSKRGKHRFRFSSKALSRSHSAALAEETSVDTNAVSPRSNSDTVPVKTQSQQQQHQPYYVLTNQGVRLVSPQGSLDQTNRSVFLQSPTVASMAGNKTSKLTDGQRSHSTSGLSSTWRLKFGRRHKT
ncbi:hypothetical protein V1514DRAFT_327030 [Lipomyces japonicus]|uniref:uncharacterized protein n=1 Tax=Lipomyces japonicus TaxID=56871 RepID=UPI0034CEB7AF